MLPLAEDRLEEYVHEVYIGGHFTHLNDDATLPSEYTNEQPEDRFLHDATADHNDLVSQLNEVGIPRDFDINQRGIFCNLSVQQSIESNIGHELGEMAESEDQESVQKLADRAHTSPDFARYIHDTAESDSSSLTPMPDQVSTPSPPSQKSATKASKRKSRSSGRNDDADDRGSRREGLRDRTARQENPFLADKVQYNLFKKGKEASEETIEVQIDEEKSKKKRRSVGKTSKDKKKPRLSSTKRNTLPSPTSTPSTVGNQYEQDEINPDVLQATLRTRMPQMSKASLPIRLKSLEEDSLAALLEKVREQWQPMLGSRTVSHYIVAFPWLDDKENKSIIFFNQKQTDAYEQMIEEIFRAPTWKDEGKCDVDLDIFAHES